MRILIVTSQFPIAGEPNRGRPLLQTVRELSRLADVTVVSPVATYPRWARPRTYLFRAPEPAARVDGFEVAYPTYPALPVVTRALNGAACGRAVQAPLARFRPDVVLAYWLYPDAYGAMCAARRAGIPLVAGARGSDLRVRDAVSRRMTRPVVRAARRLLVVSEDLGLVAQRDYGADPTRIRAIANGCDATIFRPRERAAARAEHAVPPGAKLLLYVGRLVAEKGLRELLDAFGALAPEYADLQLVLLGEGPMQAELATRIAAEGLSARLPGACPPDTVASWMAAADLVVLPSYSEGHPNALVEALACGRPVVATTVGGIPEVVDDDCGILVAPRDAKALTAALAQALARNWSEAGLAERFSRDWRQVAEETLQACHEALADASAR